MGDRVAGAHTDLHSDQGAPPGEHPGRSRDPIIKVSRHRLVGVGEAGSGTLADSVGRTTGNGSRDRSKTGRADLMAKSAPGDEVSVQ
jgi:hypothetical protein